VLAMLLRTEQHELFLPHNQLDDPLQAGPNGLDNESKSSRMYYTLVFLDFVHMVAMQFMLMANAQHHIMFQLEVAEDAFAFNCFPDTLMNPFPLSRNNMTRATVDTLPTINLE